VVNIVGSGASRQAHGGHCGCCAGFEPWQANLVTEGTDETWYALHAEGDRLTLGERDAATTFTFAISGPGMFALTLPDARGVRISDGALIASKDQPDSFVVASDDDKKVRLRTADGSYLAAGGPGAAVKTTPDAALATAFTLAPASAPTGNARGIAPKWSADPGFRDDETHSTHLWIYNRAVDWILGEESLGSGPNMAATFSEQERTALRHILSDPTFTTAVRQGIYDADNSGMTDAATSGFVFSAHFWHPVANRGGWWDPNPAINAFEYGTRYLRQSLDIRNTAQSGRLLGLAIHYLEDVTQPMHCGLYPNVPCLAALMMEAASIRAPEDLPNLVEMEPPPKFLGVTMTNWIPIPSDNYRHANYESWAMRAQQDWRLTADDLNAHDIRILRDGEIDQTHPGGDYWKAAATASLAIYRSWVNNSRSPVGADAPGAEGQIASFADAEWAADGRAMVKLAQRLVINLLLTWMSAARLAEPLR
jgi:hypothetical protein